MTEVDDRILRLQAALDGELDAAAMLDFERACAEDPALAAAFARAKAVDEALRAALPIEPAPQRLRARIAALAAPPRARLFASPLPLAASLLVGVMLGYGAGLLRPAPPHDERALVSAFLRTQIGGQSVDVVSSDRHVVKPWLAGRAPLAVAAVDLAASGFPLAGGRVEALDDRIVPTLVYRRREHRIDLTELPLQGRAGAETVFGGRDGFLTARWSDGDRTYVAVTDLPKSELADFVTLFRAAVRAEREEPRPK
ncbi:MAG TPA: anti-sigma factor [Rhodoblastus sp.]|nr:anti-sigma factor [Rhodoblastus sp.]